MDDTAPQGDSPPDFNKIDLSQLQGFSFGTQWTQDKTSEAGAREPRPDRGERRRDPGDRPTDRRDRRSFSRPAGAPNSGPGPGPERPGEAPRRAEPRNDGPRRAETRGERSAMHGRGLPPPDRTPYDSPFFATTFYPDDATFDALVKTIRASCRTIELFDIARTILDKPERFTVHVVRREGEAAQATQAPLAVSVPDGIPFETEEAAVAHVMEHHLARYFDTVEAEVEPPKGNFQVVNRCGVTGELLAPPNYHRYAQIMQLHHATKVQRMPFEAYRSRIETVRDPEVIKQWLEKMKKVTRFVWKDGPAPAPVAAPAAAPAEGTPEAPPEGSPEPAAPAEAPKALAFDSIDDARAHLLSQARDKVVRLAPHARIPGRDGALMPDGEIRRAIEGALERQRRFPLDTANALRGRLRREHFTIFKKGSKGISYVCAVKRKFRIPGQVFAENIGTLISFIEAHPLVKAGEVAKALLTAGGVALAEGAEPTPEQRERIVRIQGDLVWLVREGYITEFMDGGLYASPPIPESRKKQVELEENDPENFPEAVARPETAPETTPEAAAPAATQAAVPEPPAPAAEPAPAAAPEAIAPATETGAAPEAPAVETAPAAPVPEAAAPEAPAQLPEAPSSQPAP